MSAPVTHVDAATLAEFRAGLVTGRSGARIAAHLAGCDRCTALGDQLAGVPVLLASVPAPVLPDRVARRLDTVLAAEVTARNDAERAGREPSPEPGTRSRRAAHQGFRLPSRRVLAPVAAAAAVVLAAGGYGLSLIAGGPGSQSIASSAGSAAAKSVAGPNGAANRAAAPASLPPHSGASIRSQRQSPAGFTVVRDSTNFHRPAWRSSWRRRSGRHLRPGSRCPRGCWRACARWPGAPARSGCCWLVTRVTRPPSS